MNDLKNNMRSINKKSTHSYDVGGLKECTYSPCCISLLIHSIEFKMTISYSGMHIPTYLRILNDALTLVSNFEQYKLRRYIGETNYTE